MTYKWTCISSTWTIIYYSTHHNDLQMTCISSTWTIIYYSTHHNDLRPFHTGTQCALNAHSMRIGRFHIQCALEPMRIQSGLNPLPRNPLPEVVWSGLKWIEHLCAYGTTPDRNPRDASCVYRLEFSCLHEFRSVWKHDGSWLVQQSDENSSNRLMMPVQWCRSMMPLLTYGTDVSFLKTASFFLLLFSSQRIFFVLLPFVSVRQPNDAKQKKKALLKWRTARIAYFFIAQCALHLCNVKCFQVDWMRIECAFNPDSLQCALKRIRCEKALTNDMYI